MQRGGQFQWCEPRQRVPGWQRVGHQEVRSSRGKEVPAARSPAAPCMRVRMSARSRAGSRKARAMSSKLIISCSSDTTGPPQPWTKASCAGGQAGKHCAGTARAPARRYRISPSDAARRLRAGPHMRAAPTQHAVKTLLQPERSLPGRHRQMVQASPQPAPPNRPLCILARAMRW